MSSILTTFKKYSLLGKAAAITLLFSTAVNAAPSFPDTPLQTAASRPAANIWFILDDSGSMEFDYMPDTLATGDFNRKNPWINPLAYNPNQTYIPWRQWDGSRMTGGLNYNSVYTDASKASGTTSNLLNTTQDFYLPKNSTIPVGDTNRANYYYYSISRFLLTTNITRCEYRSGNNFDRNCVTGNSALPSSRNLDAEMANYAAWYSYHRTRMKVAKAAALDAFFELDGNVRLGYDSIWNRSQLRIPVTTDDGLFRNANKQTWFNRIINAEGSGGTPLHGALRRAGQYFRETGSNGPWGPQSGSDQFSCRQNFTILTSDGYWNTSDGYTSGMEVGNADGVAGPTNTSSKGESYTYNPARPFSDSNPDTLADVAMYYWKTDLRSDLENNVPASADNPAFWQHMVTFAISIGQQGTLNPAVDLPAIRNGSKAWPDPWRTATNNTRSWNNESSRRIDDMWHATVNGRGQFTSTSNAQSFAEGLKAALSSIQKTLASGSNVSTSSTSLQTDTRIFYATYYSGVWTGELAAYDISSAGVSQDPSWAASQNISFTNRKVFTSTPTGTGTTFPTNDQKSLMFEGLNLSGVTQDQLANYIKGDQSREISRDGPLRTRESPLGDIVNSSPIYSADSDTIFIGANDGMLHGFNASNGQERFAYVPKGLDFRALGKLAHPDYTHRFFVDGQIITSNTKQTPGTNYLVASTGRGAKGVFGLNITTPGSFNSSNVLWDLTGSTDNDMGYIIGDMLIAKTNSDENVAIVPNGIDSTSGKAVLFIIRLSDGAILKRLDTGVAGGNGLSSPRGWDSNGDGKVDYVYAGDMKGNLWKFDLSSTGTAGWTVANNGNPIFIAQDAQGNRQPIMGGLALGQESLGNRRWILFGTGRYINQNDIVNQSIQTLYGVIDGDGATPLTRSSLTERSFQVIQTGATGRSLRAFETYSPLPSSSRGWFVDLGSPYDGERVIERGVLTGRVWVVPSVIPISGNACSAAGRGFISALDAFTGTSVSVNGVNHPYFDVGSDDNQNNDWLTDKNGNKIPVGSMETDIGMVTRPVLVGDQLVYGGSSGGKETQRVRLPPAAAKRLSWREVKE